ncbi:hypothetical protein FPV67DRAFT_1681311 [Lyophyllum atratum]|nr:hypothetical protein FPV67DRAFT_1681311 [Lyophyllum atratum]
MDTRDASISGVVVLHFRALMDASVFERHLVLWLALLRPQPPPPPGTWPSSSLPTGPHAPTQLRRQTTLCPSSCIPHAYLEDKTLSPSSTVTAARLLVAPTRPSIAVACSLVSPALLSRTRSPIRIDTFVSKLRVYPHWLYFRLEVACLSALASRTHGHLNPSTSFPAHPAGGLPKVPKFVRYPPTPKGLTSDSAIHLYKLSIVPNVFSTSPRSYFTCIVSHTYT